VGESDKATRTSEAATFLHSLFDGMRDDVFLQLWAKETKSSSYLRNIDAAADSAIGINRDAYVRVSLVARNLGKRLRGSAKESIGIPGVWADIDVNGGPENKKGAAPSFEAAYELATCVLEPTLIIHSGYGLQGWWLFEDGPWHFQTVDQRERAASIAASWLARLQNEARERGFKIDATQDLARLMRVPGTFNGKGGLMAPVTGYDGTLEEGKRYGIEVIAEHGISTPAGASISTTTAGDVDIAIDFAVNPPFDKLEALRENNPQFAATWTKTRTDKPNWSPSEYCLSLASFAVFAGWEDQEVADLLIAWRRKHGDDFKYPEWYARTIRKARHDSTESKREQTREEATEELVQIGQEDGDADPDHVVSLFTDVLGGKFPVKEVIQSNLDPENAIFRLILANGTEISLAVVTGYVPKTPPKSKWVNAVNGLMKARVIRGAELTTTREQVLSWIHDYVSAMITEDVDEACMRRDPFLYRGYVWIAPKKLHAYVSRQMRQRTTYPALEEVLDTLGFEKKLKNFNDTDRDKRTSTKDYYRAPLEVLREAGSDAPGTEDDEQAGGADA
jgi:hypothetical protein